MAQAMEKSKKQLTGRQLKKIRLVLLLLPFMVFVLIFNYAPLLGWSYAFVDFKPGVSVFDSDFVGLKYFQKIVANPRDFLNVMRNTLCISFLNICCSVLPAIFAIAISQLKNKKYAKDGTDWYLHTELYFLGAGVFHCIYAPVLGKQRPEQHIDGTGISQRAG